MLCYMANVAKRSIVCTARTTACTTAHAAATAAVAIAVAVAIAFSVSQSVSLNPSQSVFTPVSGEALTYFRL